MYPPILTLKSEIARAMLEYRLDRMKVAKQMGVPAETAGRTNPCFATGAGGRLQAVMNGFGESKSVTME